jgi:hypothetical protein
LNFPKNISPRRWSLVPILAWIVAIYIPALSIYLRGDDFVDINYSIADSFSAVFNKTFLFFRPTADLILFLNYSISGTEELGYNLTTIILHLLNVTLIWGLIYQVTHKTTAAGITALLFGTSPLFIEVTLWPILRNDSILLAFFLAILMVLSKEPQSIPTTRHHDHRGHYGIATHLFVALMTIGALGTKENWLILPPLALLFVVLVLKSPLKQAISVTLPGLILMPIYVLIFFILPRLSGTATALDYSSLDGGGFQAVLAKLAFLLFHFCGMGGNFSGEPWQIGLALGGLALFVALSLILRDRLALFGASFMLLSILPTIHIHSCNSRFNYLPVAAFWIAVISLGDSLLQTLRERTGFNTRLSHGLVAVTVVCLTLFQSMTVQREISDYSLFGEFHRQIVEMYELVKPEIPLHEPFVFANFGTRNGAVEFQQAAQGIYKIINPKPGGIWEIIDFGDLADFAGDPFTHRIERLADTDLKQLFSGRPKVVVFRDQGFSFTHQFDAAIREYFRTHGSLPPGFQAYKFVPLE